MNAELMLILAMLGVAAGAMWCSGEAWAERRGCVSQSYRDAYKMAAGIWLLLALLMGAAAAVTIGFETAVCQ